MYEIAIVGDLHLSPKVSSRVDNYFEACLEKITEICTNCRNVIFLGDTFDSPTMPANYFIELYRHLNYLTTMKGNEFYAIMGNHDLYNEREESLDRTTLGLCNETNIIQVIKPDNPVNIGSYTFHTSYVNFNKCKQHLQQIAKPEFYTDTDILLLHQYYEDLYDCLTYKDLCDTGFKHIFLGHEHKPLDGFRVQTPEFTIYRCGSCGRNRADSFNLSRDIHYFILDPNLDIKIGKLECVKPSVDVFTEQAYNQDNLKKKQFINNINDVIGKYTNNINVQDKFSIKCILNELNTPEKCMQYIQNKYTQINEVFN